MKLRALAAALVLCACTPAEEAPQPEAPAHAENAAALGGAPLEGAWSLAGDGGTISAGFGPPESEFLFIATCDNGPGQASLVYDHELTPDQDTVLRIITATETLEFPARSFNEGLPHVRAEIAAGDARLAALAQPQDRFAVEVMGEVSVVPWSENLGRALSGCIA